MSQGFLIQEVISILGVRIEMMRSANNSKKVRRCNVHASTPEQIVDAARSLEDRAADSWNSNECRKGDVRPIEPLDRTKES
jgi:hypothetical protein